MSGQNEVSREQAVLTVVRMVLSNLKLEGGCADKWFKTDEICKEDVLAEVGMELGDREDWPPDMLEWAGEILMDVEKRLNGLAVSLPFEDEMNHTHRVGIAAGIKHAAKIVMSKAARIFEQGESDNLARSMRDVAQRLEVEADEMHPGLPKTSGDQQVS